MKTLRTLQEELGAGEWGTKELTDKYKRETPGQSTTTKEEADPAKSGAEKAEMIKDLQDMIRQPDPKRVQEYKKNGKNYVEMLKVKLKKLQTNEAFSVKHQAKITDKIAQILRSSASNEAKKKSIEDLLNSALKNPAMLDHFMAEISKDRFIVSEMKKLVSPPADKLEETIIERLKSDDPFVEFDAIAKRWKAAKSPSAKAQLAKEYDIQNAFSKLRGGDIKLGIANELKSRPHRKIVALDDKGEFIYVTGKPMKIHYFKKEMTESKVDVSKLLSDLNTKLDSDEAYDLYAAIQADKTVLGKVKKLDSYVKGLKSKSINNPYGKSNATSGSVNYWLYLLGVSDAAA
jgi:hypothetical protein